MGKKSIFCWQKIVGKLRIMMLSFEVSSPEPFRPKARLSADHSGRLPGCGTFRRFIHPQCIDRCLPQHMPHLAKIMWHTADCIGYPGLVCSLHSSFSELDSLAPTIGLDRLNSDTACSYWNRWKFNIRNVCKQSCLTCQAILFAADCP